MNASSPVPGGTARLAPPQQPADLLQGRTSPGKRAQDSVPVTATTSADSYPSLAGCGYGRAMARIGAVLIDIDGVLTVSWKPLAGAVAALQRLPAAGAPPGPGPQPPPPPPAPDPAGPG